jgi:hypothetical protein
MRVATRLFTMRCAQAFSRQLSAFERSEIVAACQESGGNCTVETLIETVEAEVQALPESMLARIALLIGQMAWSVSANHTSDIEGTPGGKAASRKGVGFHGREALKGGVRHRRGCHRRTQPRRFDAGAVGKEDGHHAARSRPAGKRPFPSVGADAATAGERHRFAGTHQLCAAIH